MERISLIKRLLRVWGMFQRYVGVFLDEEDITKTLWCAHIAPFIVLFWRRLGGFFSEPPCFEIQLFCCLSFQNESMKRCATTNSTNRKIRLDLHLHQSNPRVKKKWRERYSPRSSSNWDRVYPNMFGAKNDEKHLFQTTTYKYHILLIPGCFYLWRRGINSSQQDSNLEKKQATKRC